MKTLRNILLIAAFILTCVQLEAQEGRKSDIFTIKKSMSNDNHYSIILPINDSISISGVLSSIDTLIIDKSLYFENRGTFNMDKNPTLQQLNSMMAGEMKSYTSTITINIGPSTYYSGPIKIIRKLSTPLKMYIPISRLFNTNDNSRIIYINFPKRQLQVLSHADMEKTSLKKYAKFHMIHGPQENNYSIETPFYVADRKGVGKSFTGRFGINFNFSGAVALNTKRKKVFYFVYDIPQFEMVNFSDKLKDSRYYGFLPDKAGICGIELKQTTIATLETEQHQICSDEFDGLIGTRLLGYYKCYFDFDKLEFYINR